MRNFRTGWWYILAIPPLGKLRQEGYQEFEANMNYFRHYPKQISRCVESEHEYELHTSLRRNWSLLMSMAVEAKYFFVLHYQT